MLLIVVGTLRVPLLLIVVGTLRVPSEYDEWCKQVEKDLDTGKLDPILKQVDEDIRLGRCKNL